MRHFARYLFLLATLLVCLGGMAQNKTWREMHKVKKSETVYGIARQYGVTVDELMKANPDMSVPGYVLKKGDYIFIPYPSGSKASAAAKPKAVAGNDGALRVGVVLPLHNVDGDGRRMVEYYRGLLMACEDLKKEGLSIAVSAWNVPIDADIYQTLVKDGIDKCDIIFGPLYQEHIQPLAEFAQKKGIRLVIPFTSKDNSVFRNPYIYQINTPQSYLYSEVYDHFFRQFHNAHVIFLNTREGARDKAEFIKGFKEELSSRSVPMTSLSDTVTASTLSKVLRPDRENIFVPTSGSNVALIRLLPHLTVTVRQNPEVPIHLFGYPEWQTYTKDHLDAFFELDTYFYTSFYTNNLLPSAAQFTRNYRRWFAKDMEERYPKYGMLGFDTGYYFLKGLSRYGTTFEENLKRFDVTSIQTGFKFQRVNNWGGFINRKVFFVHFTKNYELIKLDFD